MKLTLLNKACTYANLECKYLKAANHTKSKPRRRRLLSRANKYKEKRLRLWDDPKIRNELAYVLRRPLCKTIFTNDILNDIFQPVPLEAPTFELDLLCPIAPQD